MSKAREQYEAHVGGTLAKVWRREGEFLVVDPADFNTPLTEVIGREAGSTRVDPDWLPSDQQALRGMDREELIARVLQLLEELDDARRQAVNTALNFVFGKGPDPLTALERLFMLARAQHQAHDWNMRQVEVASLLGRSKQDWQLMEEEVVCELVDRYSRSEFVMSGGKSASAQIAYSKAQKGNKHRAHGRKAGDEMPALPPKCDGLPTISARAKHLAELQRKQAERERLAKLCNCSPDEIDLDRIDLED